MKVLRSAQPSAQESALALFLSQLLSNDFHGGPS